MKKLKVGPLNQRTSDEKKSNIGKLNRSFLLLLLIPVMLFSCDNLVSGILDTEAVAADKAALTIGFAGNDTATSVTQNITLPAAGANGTTITWTSSNTVVIAADGAVFRPSFMEGNASVTLTATLSKGSVSDTVEFVLAVIKAVQSDAEAVSADKAALAIGYAGADTATSVTQNITLPAAGANGTTITWTSSRTAVISADGTVVRPAYTETDAAVTLTATVAKGSVSETVEFVLTVIKTVQTDAEAVSADKAALSIGYTGSDTASAVTQNLTLPVIGSNGTAISWMSSNPATVTSEGVVNQPAFLDGDAEVTLTATVAKGSVSETVQFSITVTKAAITDAEKVFLDKADLEITFAEGDSYQSITQDIVSFPALGANGSTITWDFSGEIPVEEDGSIYRWYTDWPFTLTATITCGSASDTRDFDMVVIAMEVTDEEAVTYASQYVSVYSFDFAEGDYYKKVTQDFTVPSDLGLETTAVWSEKSDPQDLVVISGSTVAMDQGGVGYVVLTLTVTRGEAIVTKDFSLAIASYAPAVVSNLDWQDNLGVYDEQGSIKCQHLERYGDYVYMMGRKDDDYLTIQVFDVSDPENLQAVEYLDISLPDASNSNYLGRTDIFDIEDDVFYAAGGKGTLYRYEIDPSDGTLSANHLVLTGLTDLILTVEVLDDSSAAYVGTKTNSYKIDLTTGVAASLSTQVLKYWGVRIGSKIYGSGASEYMTVIDTTDDSVTIGTQLVGDALYSPSVYDDRWIFTQSNTWNYSSVTDGTSLAVSNIPSSPVYYNSEVLDTEGIFLMAGIMGSLYIFNVSEICDGDPSGASSLNIPIAGTEYNGVYGGYIERITSSADHKYLFAGTGTQLISVQMRE